MKTFATYFSLLLILLSCLRCQNIDNETDEKTQLTKEKIYTINPISGDSIQPIILKNGDTLVTGKRVIIFGKQIHPDSIATPIPTPAGKPETITFATNIIKVGVPQIVTATSVTSKLDNNASIFINSFADTLTTGMPMPIKGKEIQAKLPEIVTAKDAYINNENPASFSSFSKLQGLKHEQINCMLTDQNGNLWFGTNGGGASKYDGETFTHFTEKEGLSNNGVMSMCEDHHGNIWFGTLAGGVSKYDGKTFTHFTEKEGLTNKTIMSIFEDSKGNLWFGSYGGGLSKYTPNLNDKDNTITHYTENEGLSNSIIRTILEDRYGNIWFGTSGGGAFKFDGKTFENFTEETGLAYNTVMTMLEDHQGTIWIGTYSGLSKYEPLENGTSGTFTNYTEEEGIADNRIMSLIEDRNGNIWFGTFGAGVTKFDHKNGKVGTFTTFSEKDGLSDNIVLSIMEDVNRNIWLGTQSGGVSKYNGQTFTHYTEKEGLVSGVVRSITEDNEGNIWFGTSDRGISKYTLNYQGTSASFTHFTEEKGLSNGFVRSIIQDHKGDFWFGTSGSGVTKYKAKDLTDNGSFTYLTTKEGLSHDNLSIILEDKNLNIWFGTRGGGVTKYDGVNFTHYTEKEGFPNNTILSIMEDSKGNIWFGTNGSGATKHTPGVQANGDIFTHYTEKEGLANNIVMSMIEDQNGHIWLGTNGGGATRYAPPSKNTPESFVHFTEKEGLASNFVFDIAQDNQGKIWFGTRFGLTTLKQLEENKSHQKSIKVKFLDYQINQYGYDDGFYGIGVNVGKTIMPDSKGAIWVGSNNRLTKINTNSDLFKEKQAPQITLNSISLFNEQIVWLNLKDNQDSIITLQNGILVSNFTFDSISRWSNLPTNLSLNYDNNSLSFKYVGITTHQPKKVMYQYKLDGLDKNWSGITSRSDASYGNLPHGKYTFKVKAMGSEGEWSEVLEYPFTIRPPWWKTNFAYTTYFVTFIVGLWSFISLQTRRLKKRQKELEHEVKIATQEIREQKEQVEEAHKEITDSINYAERIQRSFLATKDLLDENLGFTSITNSEGKQVNDPNYFVFFQPKEAVSGDFYWADKLSNGDFAIVNADSTGHGVPGAIMSILNITAIESAVKDKLTFPADIFNDTRNTIIARLKKDGSKNGGKDGMDASLISLNSDRTKMTYVAAQNPIWIVRNGEMSEIKPEKMPIGKHDKDQEPFIGGEFNLEKGDQIYTLTDGFQDQFGGEKGKKFMVRRMRDYVLSISHLPMQEQHTMLSKTLTNWKGEVEQVDDICVIGIRVNSN